MCKWLTYFQLSEERLTRDRAEAAASMDLLAELEHENAEALRQLEEEKLQFKKDGFIAKKYDKRKVCNCSLRSILKLCHRNNSCHCAIGKRVGL